MFRSQLENLMPAEELTFDPTPGFGSAYKKFLGHAIAHPAKANTVLLEFLIKRFTVEGETVLDPMCGSGSTGIVAAVHGRNAVQVDIERKFVDWAEEARRKIEAQATLTPKGSIRNICGDSRKLSELLKSADVVLTSPPYSQTISKHAGGKCSLKNVGISTKTARSYDAIVTSPPYSESMTKKRKGYTTHENLSKTRHMGEDTKDENIANLPHGNVDAVITSPPYSEAQDGHGIAKKGYQGKKHSPTDLVGDRSYMPNKFENEQNISRLKYDAVITSPPYADGAKGPSRSPLWNRLAQDPTSNRYGRKKHPTIGEGYGKDEENIGNLPFDAVITSPPYEGSFEGGSRHTGGICEREKGKDETMLAIGEGVKYSESKDQIGNMKRETYLEAMLKVYMEMYKVLKPNGEAIIIIKPFIRNKQVVDLPFHTWLLLERVGFKLFKLYKLRLKQTSFWRILYHKKFPSVPQIRHEYVLVCQKRLEAVPPHLDTFL